LAFGRSRVGLYVMDEGERASSITDTETGDGSGGCLGDVMLVHCRRHHCPAMPSSVGPPPARREALLPSSARQAECSWSGAR
jgi:hypothetical protein